MLIAFSPECKQKLRNIKKKDVQLFKKISKKLSLFEVNPTYRSLRLHKLKGELKSTWSISVSMSVRLIFYYRQINKQTQVVFIDIGTHNEIYKK